MYLGHLWQIWPPPNYGGALIREGALNRQNTVLVLLTFFVICSALPSPHCITSSSNLKVLGVVRAII